MKPSLIRYSCQREGGRTDRP